MFALELDFHDGVSQPEILLVRRPHAVIGTSEYAHVVIEGAGSSMYELRVARGIGREFHCQPVSKGSAGAPPFVEGVYSGEVELNLGEVTTHITPLDIDLQLEANESADFAGVRILRQALGAPSPMFPAVAVLGSPHLFVSFPEERTVTVGRSRKCSLRLDASDVSSEHARIGYKDGQFWVEDLGSTNGTYVEGERVAGRKFLEADQLVSIGSQFTLAGVVTREQVLALGDRKPERVEPAEEQQQYPCVLSSSELIRPARYLLTDGAEVRIGRDPANDIWVGAAYVSRNHLEVRYTTQGGVVVTDVSSNGSMLDGERMTRDQGVSIEEKLALIDFGGEVKFSICYSEEDEKAFYAGAEAPAEGAPEAASGEVPAPEQFSPLPERPDGAFQKLVARQTPVSSGVDDTISGLDEEEVPQEEHWEEEYDGTISKGQRLVLALSVCVLVFFFLMLVVSFLGGDIFNQ